MTIVKQFIILHCINILAIKVILVNTNGTKTFPLHCILKLYLSIIFVPNGIVTSLYIYIYIYIYE